MRGSPWWIAVSLIIAGAVLVLFALLADIFGLGHTPGYYGHYQFIATVAGLSLVVLGTAVLLSTVHVGEDE